MENIQLLLHTPQTDQSKSSDLLYRVTKETGAQYYYQARTNWVEIKGFPGYFISADGVVLSLRGNKLRALSPYVNTGTGVLMVHIVNSKGQKKQVGVHRLVAQAFIPNPEGKKYVRNINSDKSDNRVENLEWCDFKDTLNR